MSTANPSAAHYRIECACGDAVEGERQARGQVVHCPKCGRPIQVFPASPLPTIRSAPKQAPTPSRPPHAPTRLRFWLVPGLAAAGTLAVIVGVTVWTLRQSDRVPATDELSEGQAHEQFAACVASARAAAGEGAYRTASERLAEALRLCLQFPQPAPSSAGKLRNELRQTKLLADLSAESIQEIVRHAVGLSPAEWKTVFAERYVDKAVAFDVRVDPTDTGGPRIDYVAMAAGSAIECEVGSLDLWQHLPLRQPTRCLFGARLAAVAKDGGRWVVRFRPGSGVLFTDPDLLGGLSFAVDDGLRDVLRRQSEWAADLPADRD